MDWTGYDGVEVIEDKVSGVPLIKNTRVPADLVAECLEEGETINEMAFNYRLNPDDIVRLGLYMRTNKQLAEVVAAINDATPGKYHCTSESTHLLKDRHQTAA